MSAPLERRLAWLITIGAPEITDARQQADVAPPRYGKQTLMGTALLLAIVASVAVGYGFVVLFSG